MIIDSSAVLAILLRERDAATFAEAIWRAPVRRISAASYLEAAIRLDAATGGEVPELDAFMQDARIEIARSLRRRPELPGSPGANSVGGGTRRR